MNEVRLVGGIVRDPDVKITNSGTASWMATIAVNGARYSPEERQQVVSTTYVSLSAFGWMAEQLIDAGYGKGDELYVVGELDQFEVTGEDGKKDRKTKVRVLTVTPTRRRISGGTPQPAQTGHWSEQPAAAGRDPWSAQTEEPPF